MQNLYGATVNGAVEPTCQNEVRFIDGVVRIRLVWFVRKAT